MEAESMGGPDAPSDQSIAIDLFAGAGGMSLGFEQAGFRVIGAIDIEPTNTEVYAQNFPQTKCLTTDISKLSGRDIRKEFGKESTEIDVLFGGPPCQGFSVGGRRKTDDPRNNLISDFARLVEELRPRAFVMENVGGLLSSGRNIYLDFLARVRSAGYRLAEDPMILDAADYGVPQRRKRMFVVGLHERCQHDSRPPAQVADKPTVADALFDLPEVTECEDLLHRDRDDRELGPTESPYALAMRDVPSGRTVPDGLGGCRRTAHGKTTIRRFEATTPGHREPISRFMRLEPAGVAPTLRAGSDSDHGSFTAPRPIHPLVPRCITVREAARLHSLPDWFELHPTKWHGFRQVGNSVPPMLAKAVAGGVASALQQEAVGALEQIGTGDP